jgi:hypothetical protein
VILSSLEGATSAPVPDVVRTSGTRD